MVAKFTRTVRSPEDIYNNIEVLSSLLTFMTSRRLLCPLAKVANCDVRTDERVTVSAPIERFHAMVSFRCDDQTVFWPFRKLLAASCWYAEIRNVREIRDGLQRIIWHAAEKHYYFLPGMQCGTCVHVPTVWSKLKM